MIIERIVEGKAKANSYVVIQEKSCFIVDMNINVIPFLNNHNLNPKYVFLTHEHFDHIRGVTQIKELFPETIIISSKITSELMVSSQGNLSFFLDGKGFNEIGADIFTEDKNTFEFNNNIIKTYYTPGHSTGGIIISIDNILFTGDTLLDIRTPVTLPNSSKEQLKESIEFIDKNFDNNTIFYQGHGEPFPKSKWNKNTSLYGNKKINK